MLGLAGLQFVGEMIDHEYDRALGEKAELLYALLYNDPLNSLQRYFPDKLAASDGSVQREWWKSLIYRTQIYEPKRLKRKPD